MDTARRKGLLRSDAVVVTGPPDTETGGKQRHLVFRITVPSATSADRIQIDVSGDCDTAIAGEAPRTRQRTVPVARNIAIVVVRASVPASASRCYVTVDALAPERPDTGDGYTVMLRR